MKKANIPIVFTEFGMFMDCREVHFWKVRLSISVTESGMLTDFSEVH